MLNQKFGRDLLWNYGSLGLLALGGILSNLIIAGVYGAAVLGVFNQVYAAYVMASQLAAGGIQYSVLRKVAEGAENLQEVGRASWSAVGSVLLLSLPVAALVFFLADSLGALLNSPAVGETMVLAAPGLVFFSLNKVLLGILNGLRRMRVFAVGQALRSALSLAYVAAIASLGIPGRWLGATFTFAELGLAMVLLALVVRRIPLQRTALSLELMKGHILFGFKGFMSGVMLETNARVDVIMLGVFLNDRLVGLYAFAAVLAEGFYNLLGVVRNNTNPLLVRLVKEQNREELMSLVRPLRRFVYASTAGISLVLLGVYRPAIYLLSDSSEFLNSFSILAILVGGILFCSGYVPFDFILLQADQPGYHTLLAALNLGTNIVLNVLLIPHYGIYGAAMGTASALILSVFYLNWLVRRRLSFSLN